MMKLVLALSVVGGFALTGSNAEARWTQSSVFGCHNTGGSMIDSQYAIGNNSTTQDMVLRCDAPDASYDPKYLVADVVVNGRDGNPSRGIAIQVCRSTYDVIGGACSSPSTSSNADVKNVELTASKSVWNVSNRRDYGFVAIRFRRVLEAPSQGSRVSSTTRVRAPRFIVDSCEAHGIAGKAR